MAREWAVLNKEIGAVGSQIELITGPGTSIACRLQASHAATHPAAGGTTISVCRLLPPGELPAVISSGEALARCRNGLHTLLTAHPAGSAGTMGELLSLG